MTQWSDDTVARVHANLREKAVMTTPNALDRLRTTVAEMTYAEASECYTHMVWSRQYLPVDDIGGKKAWRDVRELFDDDDEALRFIGSVLRGRLGV